MIDRQTIDLILSRADILDVVGDYVSLRQRGANWVSLCPFHNEKTPSFSVSPSRGIYKCFGCGKGGNALNFIMEVEHLSFVDAVRFLGKKVGVAVDYQHLRARLLPRHGRTDDRGGTCQGVVRRRPC